MPLVVLRASRLFRLRGVYTKLLLRLTSRRLGLTERREILHLLTGKLPTSLAEVSKVLHLLASELAGSLTEISKHLRLLTCELACGLSEISVLRAAGKYARQVGSANAAHSASQLCLTSEVGLSSAQRLTVTLLRGLSLRAEDRFLSVTHGARAKLTHTARAELTGFDERIRHAGQHILSQVASALLSDDVKHAGLVRRHVFADARGSTLSGRAQVRVSSG